MGETFANHVSDKRLIFKMYKKKPVRLGSKEPNNPFKKWADWNRIFAKEDREPTDMRRCSASPSSGTCHQNHEIPRRTGQNGRQGGRREQEPAGTGRREPRALAAGSYTGAAATDGGTELPQNIKNGAERPRHPAIHLWVSI